MTAVVLFGLEIHCILPIFTKYLSLILSNKEWHKLVLQLDIISIFKPEQTLIILFPFPVYVWKIFLNAIFLKFQGRFDALKAEVFLLR